MVRSEINWLQRGILVAAGALLTLVAFHLMDGYDDEPKAAILAFTLAAIAFFIAASSKRKPNED